MAEIPNDMERRLKMIEEASKSLAAYNDLLKSTRDLEINIEHVERMRLKLQKEIDDAQYKINNNKKLNLGLSKKEISELEKKIAALEHGLSIEEETLKAARAEVEVRKQAIKEVSKLNLVINSTLNLSKKLGNEVLRQNGYFLEQQKSVKETELSMGILSNQSNGFRNNIYKASITSNTLGVNTKDLAKIQGTYSDNIGRAVQLSEEELNSMAALAKGTMLGAEGAAEFAAQMENFNISAEGSVDYIQEVVDLSSEMGLNSNKVIKNIQKNMKLLNKYNFEGGAKGLGKMAALATKFKFEMQDIASFAESIMTPEGAVEVASKLQVLGGEWAKLGDPFELMYRSRNDIKGLTEDVINATKATARFDETTGEVTIDPMEMQRLREVANATGMSFDSLASSAREAAKFTQIQSGMSSLFSQDDKDLLASMAKFDKKTGEFKVTMQTEDGTVTESVKSLRQITPAMVKSQREFKATLEDRAVNAQTFNERFDNLLNTFKSGLLPSFEVIAKALESVITAVEPTIKSIAEFAAEWPKTIAGMAAVLGGAALIGDKAMWLLNGRLLRTGFNSGGPIGGAGGGAGGSGVGGSGGKGFFGRGGAMAKNAGKIGKFSKIGGAIGGGLISAWDEYSENEEAGMAGGENAGRTAIRGVGGGLGGWGGAAAGAALGTAIFPGVGTLLGGLIGGGLGAYGGSELGDIGGDMVYGGDNSGNSMPRGNTYQDFISRPGENPISFSSDDSLIGAKKGGPIDKIMDQNVSGGGGTNGGKLSVEFNKPIKIEGKIEVASGNNSKEINLDDPIFMQSLGKMIMQEIDKAVSGGKLGSNPSPA
tara:strand:+ start:1465 stop:3936 length:2472 start_codon:yes stop_codon:yes gene_type:complete